MYCFNKSRRLHTPKEFSLVFEQAKKLVTHELIFFYKKNQLNSARIGFAISKKSIPKSHDRNRIKRHLRESFRLSRLPKIDIVVISKKSVTNLTCEQLREKIGQAWDKLGVLCEK